MLVLAVDPGTTSGYAVFDDQKLVYKGCILGKPALNWVNMCGLVQHIQPTHFVVEDQYIRGARQNVMVLIESRFAWENIARVEGCHLASVGPSVWQEYYGLHTNKKIRGKYKRKKDFKNRIRLKAESVFGVTFLEDESDAALIGKYALETFDGD